MATPPLDLSMLSKPLLDDSHLPAIQNALAIIQATKAHIAQAKQAGINVDVPEQKLLESESKLLQIKNTYFPGR